MVIPPRSKAGLAGILLRLFASLLVGLAARSAAPSACAQEKPASPPSSAPDAPGDAAGNPSAGTQKDEQKERAQRQAFAAGVLLITLTLVSATLVVGLLLAWSRRLRKLARAHAQPATRLDELWFLKTGRPKDDEPRASDRGPSVQEDK
jgi:hypothetical protein